MRKLQELAAEPLTHGRIEGLLILGQAGDLVHAVNGVGQRGVELLVERGESGADIFALGLTVFMVGREVARALVEAEVGFCNGAFLQNGQVNDQLAYFVKFFSGADFGDDQTFTNEVAADIALSLIQI